MFSLCSLYGERPLSALNNQTEILCEIPKLSLLPGTYRINYEVNVNGQCVDSQVSARNLQVVAGNYFGSSLLPARSATPICVDCKWRVNSIPHRKGGCLSDGSNFHPDASGLSCMGAAAS